MFDLEVEGLSDFLSEVAAVSDAWSADIPYFAKVWFRGQANSNWSLLPGLYREDEIYEDILRAEFERRASPLMSHRIPESHWEWYFTMQHYGLPTRLLDWTEGALLALYFAVRAKVEDSSPAVWMLHPSWLNSQVLGKRELMYVDESEVEPYLSRPYKRSPVPSQPIAITPRHINQRIVVQKSCFTIFGSSRDGLDGYCMSQKSPRLTKFVFPAGSAETILRSLNRAGISESSVFPDIEGLSRELNYTWGAADDCGA